MTYRVSVDVGGTFTDVVVADSDGSLVIGKGLTTPDRPFAGFLAGLESAAEQLALPAHAVLAQATVLVYGTTRATNAIVEGKVARTALLVTAGFPDILSYRQGGKHNPFELSRDFPAPYIPRNLTYEVPERVNSEGGVELALDEAAVAEIAERLRRRKVEAVAVSFLWSIVNGAHERRVGELLAELLPDVAVTLSHELNPIVREYPRTSSTAIDASLKPIMQRHLRSFSADAAEAGFAGELLISTSAGGVMHIEDVVARPVNMVRSGPAMAPLAGLAFAAAEGLGDDVIVVDTGGTTFDVSVIRDGRIKSTRETWLVEELVGHNLGVPTVDARSVGAGGGSIAWVDPGGLLRVGPHSAGADPGPACYGRGGTAPTVTDAAVVLGYIDPDEFLGGRMRLDRAAAESVVGELATTIGMGLEQAASAILRLSGEEMVKAIEQITIRDGLDPSESAVVAGGGAAGLGIVPIARTLGCRRVLVPQAAGVLSAYGAQHSDIVLEVSGSCYAHSDEFDHDGVDAVLARIDGQLDGYQARLAARGITRFERQHFVEARYLNQQWEMEVPLPVRRVSTPADVAALRAAFDGQHQRLYEVHDTASPLECVNWKGRLTAVLAKPHHAAATGTASAATPDRFVQAYFDELGAVATPVHRGYLLAPGTTIEAPAIIIEPTTTIVVHPGSRCTVTAGGNYLLEIEPETAAARSAAGSAAATAGGATLDKVQLAVLANRLDAILREMTETVLLTARSSVIGMARDFSCGIVSSEDELLAIAAGLPMHVYGGGLQAASMRRNHPEFREGDAFVHNDPYDGNSHAADHTVLVPVFHEGEHVFTVSVKSHQADTGNSLPTTYMASAKDVYEEGTLIFPCVLAQRDYIDNDDFVRMCRRRIRVPDQWQGDFISGIAAARVGERGLKALVAKYGLPTVRTFVTEWLDYTARRVEAAIRELPAAQLVATGRHDPVLPFLPDGIEITVKVDVLPEEGRIVVDLTGNPDNMPNGLNLTQATATMGAAQAVFCSLPPDIQHNAGSFRHVQVLLREGCVTGIPRFPFSCSVATTNVSDMVVNLTQSVLAELGDGHGLAMTNFCNSAGAGVVSGKDWRKHDEGYVNQIFLMGGGGPATPTHDGLTYCLTPPGLGLLYRDSVEIDEQRTPFLVREVRLVTDSAGAGRSRGGPATRVTYGARQSPLTVIDVCNGTEECVPRGVRGGHDAKPASNTVLRASGARELLPTFFVVELQPGDAIQALDNGGGGYGDPHLRPAAKVLGDVREGLVSAGAAREVYGVAVTGSVEEDTLAVDAAATALLRQR